MRGKLKYIKEGSKLKCHKCDKYIFKTKRDVFAGEQLSPIHVNVLKEGYEIVPHSRVECCWCGEELSIYDMRFSNWEQPNE